MGAWRFVPFYRDFKRLLVSLERDLDLFREPTEASGFWTSDWDRPAGPSEVADAPLGWTKLFVDGGLTGSVALSIASGAGTFGDGGLPCICLAAVLLPVWVVVWFVTLLSHLHLAALATQYAGQVKG